MDISRNLLYEGEIINNKQLMEWFGTDKQKRSYEKNNKIQSYTKDILLSQANKFCDIEDLGRGQYKITNVKEKADLIAQNHNDLLFLLIGALLGQIAYEILKNPNKKWIVSTRGIAKKIGLINDKYDDLRYDSEKLTNYIRDNQYNSDTVYECIYTLDNALKRLISKALDKICLTRSKGGYNIGDYEYLTVVVKRRIYDEDEEKLFKLNTDSKGNVGGNIIYYDNNVYHIIENQDDIDYVYNMKRSLMKSLHIAEEQDCYYGEKANLFKRQLKDMLFEKNILYTYRNYVIRIMNDSRCIRLIKDVYGGNTYNELLTFLNQSFCGYLDSLGLNKYKTFNEKLRKLNELYNTNPSQLPNDLDDKKLDFDLKEIDIKIAILLRKKHRQLPNYIKEYKQTNKYLTE